VDKSVQEKAVGKNANKKIVGPCNRCEERVCTAKRKGILFVKRRERGGKRIHERAVEKGVYLTTKVTTNSASIFCGEEGQKEKDGARLQVSQ